MGVEAEDDCVKGNGQWMGGAEMHERKKGWMDLQRGNDREILRERLREGRAARG